MHQNRVIFGRVANVRQNRNQLIETVSVYRSDVIKAQFFKQSAARNEPFGVTFGFQRGFLDKLGQTRRHVQSDLTQSHIGFRRNQMRQMMAQRPDGTRDRHVVVVQNHDQTRIFRSRVVQCFKRHARTHRPVADNADDVVLSAPHIAPGSHADRRRYGRGTVSRAKRIILAFTAFRKTGQPVFPPQCVEFFTPSRQQFVRVALMSDVPNQFIVGRVEHIMQSDRQFDDAQTGAQMPARVRHDADNFLPDFLSQTRQIVKRQLA